jgi:fluoroquinolone transport system permease protein
MNRVAATMVCDARLQFRNGFYFAAGVVAVFWMLALTQLPDKWLTLLMPVFVMSNLTINNFYFIAGLILLEKAEGSLESRVVTPLRPGEYLLSKVATLTGLSILENVLIVIVAVGSGVQYGWLIAGIVGTSVLYGLIGFLVVARYDSINEYLFPSALYTTFLSLPLLYYFDIVTNPLMMLHPLLGPLMLLQAAFQEVSAWKIVYALLITVVATCLFFLWCQRAFVRFVIRKERGR